VQVKTFVYVDGFNLYFGCLKGTPYKWLDVGRLCALMLPGNRILRIKYFTAKVSARPSNPSAPVHQEIFLRALRAAPHLEIIFGHFLTHEVTMPVAHPMPGQSPFVRVIKTEEKGSDVNLATHLLHDAHLGKYDAAVVVSGDSDLLAAIRSVMQDLKKPVGVLNPQKRTCNVLARQATFYKHIRAGVLAASQLPSPMKDTIGSFHKPPSW
jgi:uncharacterized LabA/DUF88 family protein